ncbi:MAG: hypothetical protein JWM32_1577 [Verrucomicrobia bacterium]|nr:hypothetical protein [Verrucomicrobiota bacterium]
MSNSEAKFLLEGYRANGRDADNPAFAEALAQARRDPALGAWFARSQACDLAIAAKLGEVAPPAGLREAILAGARASRVAQPRALGPMTWLAMAAGLAVLLTATVALWPNRAAAQAARLTEFAFDDTAHGQHGGHGAAAGALQVMLGQPANHLSAGLPVDFSTLRATGCRTLSLAGRDVLEVCFNRNGEWFHCYIARRTDFPDESGAGAVFAQKAQLASASWSDAKYRFVVISEAGLDAVKRLL